MKHRFLKWSACALLALLIPVLGCNRPVPPPTPLPAAEFPSAMEKAFATAKPDLKELATQVVNAVQAKEFTKAYALIQTLATKPELNKEQRTVTSRGTLTVNELLQAAQAQGDQKAAQTLKFIRENK